ncbi:hypothetical protein D3C73_1512270 [compost metagenome]
MVIALYRSSDTGITSTVGFLVSGTAVGFAVSSGPRFVGLASGLSAVFVGAGV